MTYAEKLKDPRWQKKRLEVFNRDSFTCQICGEAEKTLHVHHKYYIFGKEPWEYDLQQLITLCLDCHEVEEIEKINLKNYINEAVLIGYTYSQLTGIITGLLLDSDNNKAERVRAATFCACNANVVLNYLHNINNSMF